MNGDPRTAPENTDGAPPDAAPRASDSTNPQQTLNEEPPLAAPQEAVFYIPSSPNGPLRQAEILSNVFQFGISVQSLNDLDHAEIEWVTHDLAIILSQDCDLDQDFKRRQEASEIGPAIDSLDDKLLPTVLMCQVATEKAIEDAIRSQGRTIRERFRQNHEERYQFLRAVKQENDAAGIGLEAMGIDFKRYFTVPTDELYAQLKGDCQRRCRLAPQYLEHFSKRFTNHLSRVGLPKNHHEP